MNFRAERIQNGNFLNTRTSLACKRSPPWQCAFPEEHFCRPLSEVGGESYAMASVGAEDDGILAGGVEIEHWQPAVAEQDGATPAVGERDRAERRVKAANARFERSKHLRSFCA